MDKGVVLGSTLSATSTGKAAWFAAMKTYFCVLYHEHSASEIRAKAEEEAS
jgi:hypothetical protein